MRLIASTCVRGQSRMLRVCTRPRSRSCSHACDLPPGMCARPVAWADGGPLRSTTAIAPPPPSSPPPLARRRGSGWWGSPPTTPKSPPRPFCQAGPRLHPAPPRTGRHWRGRSAGDGAAAAAGAAHGGGVRRARAGRIRARAGPRRRRQRRAGPGPPRMAARAVTSFVDILPPQLSGGGACLEVRRYGMTQMGMR